VSDNLPTVWSADSHTVAKHQILQAYLSAWLPILSYQSTNLGASGQSIKYIDGFAGPGIYERGQKGSPLLALEAALNHGHEFPTPVEFTFIEDDKDRFIVLKQQLDQYAPQVASSRNVRRVNPVHGDCREVIDGMLVDVNSRRQKFGPALVFLDQFGYSAVPMELISRILAQPQCEVLTFFFWRELDRFVTDATKHPGITAAFGGEDWKPAIALRSREQFMQDTYMKCLKGRAKAKYVWPFAMTDHNSRLLCWLFFCTNNLRGLEEMKKAMWKVDRTGGFSFSDKHGLDQLSLLTSYGEDRLEEELERGLAGRKISVLEIKEWVLTETPAYLFKGALAKLEKRGILKPLNPTASRRTGKFPDDELILEFSMPPLFGN
jgi:three-Cys-motif partner protein